MTFLAEILALTFSAAGFTIAAYIHATKKADIPLVCPLEGSCERVVHSDYSKIFGLNVEILGMIYYSFIFVFYAFFVLLPSQMPYFGPYLIVGVCLCGFLFSMYLTSIQMFVIKHWCTWCLFSALMCTVIFILTLFIANTKVLDLLMALR